MKHFMAIVVMFSLLILQQVSAANGPLVGRLSGRSLATIVNSSKRLLELDLEASISTIQCSGNQLRHLPLKINTTDGANPKGVVTIAGVPFKCGSVPKAGLLATSPRSLPAFFAAKNKISNKFSYCLTLSASSPSPIFFGVDNVAFMPNKRPISPLLQHTPLQFLDHNSKMGIRILSVDFNATKIASIPPMDALLSTTEQYTKLPRPAYNAVRDAFRRLTGIPRATPPPKSPPFETCFKASALGSTRVGPAVPQLDLHLAGNVTWSIFGANSIVQLGDAACVAVLPAAPGQRRAVIGAYTQRDNLIEFDIQRRRFGFSSILYFFQTTCANFNFTMAA